MKDYDKVQKAIKNLRDLNEVVSILHNKEDGIRAVHETIALLEEIGNKRRVVHTTALPLDVGLVGAGNKGMLLVATCNDGSLWCLDVFAQDDAKWLPMKDIPQD